jgi:tetratricopeptide (TPR) repeat protein
MPPAPPGDTDADLVALMRAGRLTDAEALCRRRLARDPGDSQTLNNLGYILDELGRLDEAEAAYRRASDARPDFAEAPYNLGLLLQGRRRLEEAEAAYAEALARDPRMAQAHNNRGAVLRDLRRLDEALAAFEAAVRLRPDYADAQFNQAMCRLLMGDSARGWAQYEWRWRIRQADRAQRGFDRPPWLGREDPRGRRILLHAEQGLGDTLQFCRYAPRVAALGAGVILEVQPGLERLLRGLAGVDVVVRQGDAPPSFDLHTPLMSLPLALASAGDACPGGEPYLSADPALTAQWARRLAGIGGLKVGLVWAGAARPDQPIASAVDRRRSLPLEAFAPLSAAPGVRFFSLQKGAATAQLARLDPGAWPGAPIIDHTAALTDFAETAALVANLDLVISCDTSVAHLAGAMGKPVWILSRFDGCWRWGAAGETTPWYVSARLFRQARHGDWAGVIERVGAALRGLEQ